MYYMKRKLLSWALLGALASATCYYLLFQPGLQQRSVFSAVRCPGQTVVIDHGNGYETSYSHLSKINVRKGQTVRRGDIIALSGDTGLSLAPHLHYEVRLDGMRVDPIHYFFMELTPTEYQRLMRIAQTGMQSFD